jgi:hypothetical protein
MDFFTPEAGQRRRQWLDNKMGSIAGNLDYYLGPTGIPDKMGALANLAAFTDAGDFVEAGDASQALWNDPSIANLGRYATAGAALALPVVSARGMNVLSDAGASGIDDLRQFVESEDGAFAGIRALTADRGALERAQAMTEAGASRDDIWRDTGWFRGVDGQWRFEIDDSNARLTSRVTDAYNNPQMKAGVPWVPRIEGTLLDVIDHPELLYRSYGGDDSFFGDATLSRAMTPEGAYDASTDGIRSIGPDLQTHRSTILHELQHAIQEREGFARGGNIRVGADLVRDEAAGEIMAIEDALAARSVNLEPWRQRLWNNYLFGDRVAGENAIIDTLDDELIDLLSQSNRLNVLRERSSSVDPDEAYRGYKRIAGEVEARNVQTRRDFSPDQRRAVPPWLTQDVPDDQQIVRLGQILSLR